MGSAFAQLLADSGNEVSLVGTHLDRDIIASILADGTHPGLKVKLPEKVRAFYVEDLEQVLDDRVVIGSGHTKYLESIEYYKNLRTF